MVTRTCSNCGHHQRCSPHDPEVSCAECGADLSEAEGSDEVGFVDPADDTPENRDIVATVEARSPRDPSQDVPLDKAEQAFDGMDVRHSEMLADREQRRAGYQG